MKIVWINPVGDDQYDSSILQRLCSVKRAETVIDIISLKELQIRNLEYASYEAFAVPYLVKVIKEIAEDGVSATIIGCFYDVGLRAAREVSGNMHVVGPCQSSLSLALTLGNNYSVLVGRSKWIPRIKENILSYGMSSSLASIQSLDLCVEDMEKNVELSFSKMLEGGKKAIEKDNAEVIVLGCTAADKYSERLQDALGVPVVDPLLIPFKWAEYVADVSLNCNIYPSRIHGSESPAPQCLEQLLSHL